MVRLPGSASVEATGEFAARSRPKVAPHHFRRSESGLTLSSLGLGTYLGRPDGRTDQLVEAAVGLCLQSGRVNVIDTAINYRSQRAERSVGRAVARTIESGAVRREMVFLSTKVGYLAPDAESELAPAEWIERTLLRPGIVRPEEIVDGSHSMAPKYLVDQVDRSRANLGVETIDLLYLHNAPDSQLRAVGPEEFATRLTSAFEVLEGLRSNRWIGAYGLATWDSLRTDPRDPSYPSLEAAVQVARGVAGPSHGFRFVQFPFNWAMREAATSANQRVRGEPVTLFEAARRLGVGCFTSIPLAQGQLARSGPVVPPLSRAQTALQFARSAPQTIAPLVGQKSPEHLSENLAVAGLEPWEPDEFRRRSS